MWKIFNSKTKTFTSAAFLIAFSTAFSGILGLLRDRLLASRLGAGSLLDIYFASFKIPDFIYYILIAGGVGAAFLPLLSQAAKKKRDLEFANNFLNCILVVLVFLVVFLFLLTPFLIDFIAPGFSESEKAKTCFLTRIILLNPIIFGVSTIFSGILQYHQKFLAFCLAPILYNLGIILGILFLLPSLGLKGVAFGVILGAFLHLMIQFFPAKNSGFRYLPILNFKTFFMKKALLLMTPRIISQTIAQLNLIFVNAIASTLISGSISIFNLSNNISFLPMGIIGVSFAVASFPFFSKSLALGKKEKFLRDFSSSLKQILFLIIPFSALLFALRAQIVRLILGAGQFGWWETRLTAASLGIFALGLFAATLIPLFLRAFFAFQDTKSPLIAGVASVILNIIFCLLFVSYFSFENPFSSFFVGFLKLEGIESFQVISLPLALSLSQIFQFLVLFLFFTKKFPSFRLKEISNSLKKILLATPLMVFFTYFGLRLGAEFFFTRTVLGLLLQTILATILGILVYLLTAFFLKSEELKTITSVFKSRFLK